MRKLGLVGLMLVVVWSGMVWGQTTGDYKSDGNVVANAATNWLKWDGSAWVTATAKPANCNVTVLSTHQFNPNSSATFNSLTIQSGASVVTGSSTININNGGVVDNSGLISSGALNVYMTGAGNIKGTFNELRFSTPSTTHTATGDININTRNGLNSGKLNMGAYKYTLNSGATLVSGTTGSSSFSASCCITTDGTSGSFSKVFTATGNYIFPIGTTAGAYTPVSINPTATTYGTVNVKPVAAQEPNSSSPTTDQLNRYWTITESGFTGISALASTYTYADADITGTEASYVSGYYVGSTWTQSGSVTAASNLITLATPTTNNATFNVTAGETANFVSCTAPASYSVSSTQSTICNGSSINITLSNSQSGVTYQLLKGGVAEGGTTPGTGSSLSWSVSPSTTSTYTVKTTTAGGYCETTMSGSALITVNAATSISSQSTATQTKYVGEAFNAMTVTAAGTGTLTYQWKSSDDAAKNTSEDDANVGTNSNSFTPSSASAGTKYYYCVVTGDCGTATSSVSGAIITNNTVPTVVLTSGSNTTTVNVNAAMTSAVYTYNYVGDDANVSAEWYTNDTYSSTTSAPTGLSITKDTEANTITVSGTPANGVYGTLYYKLIVNETNGNAIEGVITVNVPTPTINLSSANNTQRLKANNPIANIVYTLTNVTGAVTTNLPDGLSGSYNNGTYTISGTVDANETPGTYNFTVTATAYTGYGGSAVTSSGTIVVKATNAKEICYIVTGASQSTNDIKLFPTLNDSPNYIVTLRTAAASAPAVTVYDNFDLIILNETVDGKNPEALALKSVNKPILSLKSYTYTTGRWSWGTPNNGLADNGTVNIKQPTHPIFNNVTLTNGTLALLNGVSGNGVQPTDVTIGGINVALAPKLTNSGIGVAIHDVPASVRAQNTSQTITSKYLLVAISDNSYAKMTNAALTLLTNAVDYLISGTQFVAEPIQYRTTGTGDWSALTWESSADGTNWSQDVTKPATGNVSEVTIQATSTINLTANTTFDALSLATGAVLNINAGQQLTINDSFTNNGTIHLKSDANGTATALLPSNVSGTGAAIAEQYLATTRNWYISSPVSNAKAPAGYTYYQRDEAGSSWTSRPFVADSTFVRGRGYIALPGSEAAVITFSTETGGSLNTGDIPVYLTFAGTSSKGYNLIGNPYPSHLTWTKTFVDNNASLIEPSIYYRTTTGTANNQTGWSFKTINASTGEVSPLGTSNTIPPMQAFWIRAKATGTLTLNSDLTKSHNASNPLKAPATKNADRQRLRLQVDNGTTTDEAVIYFDAAASDAYDRYDSPKFNEANTVTQIYTTAGSEKLVINGMHSLPLNHEIGLGFVPGSSTAFSLRATELTNIPSDVRVILKDNVSKAETDLTDGVSVYEFAPATTTGNRFSVIFRTAGVTTGFEKSIVPKAYVYVNANNQITINAPEKSNYSIYNAVGQLMENGILNSQFIIHNSKLATGVYVVKVDNQSIRVVIK